MIVRAILGQQYDSRWVGMNRPRMDKVSGGEGGKRQESAVRRASRRKRDVEPVKPRRAYAATLAFPPDSFLPGGGRLGSSGAGGWRLRACKSGWCRGRGGRA